MWWWLRFFNQCKLYKNRLSLFETACFIDKIIWDLNSHVKSVLTAWAYDRVLSSLLWESEIVATGGAALVNVSFSVTEFALNQIEMLLGLFHKIKICGVFPLSFVNIS